MTGYVSVKSQNPTGVDQYVPQKSSRSRHYRGHVNNHMLFSHTAWYQETYTGNLQALLGSSMKNYKEFNGCFARSEAQSFDWRGRYSTRKMSRTCTERNITIDKHLKQKLLDTFWFMGEYGNMDWHFHNIAILPCFFCEVQSKQHGHAWVCWTLA